MTLIRLQTLQSMIVIYLVLIIISNNNVHARFRESLLPGRSRPNFIKPADYALALGVDHVKDLFPTGIDFIDAIHHKWDEIDDIITANSFPSAAHSGHKHIHEFMICNEYSVAADVIRHLREDNSLLAETVYSSALDNRVCFVASIDLASEGISHSKRSVLYDSNAMLVPVPNLLKYERGFHQTVDWDSFPHVDQNARVNGKLTSEMQTEFTSPMTHKLLLSGENLQLSAVFRKRTSFEDIRASISRWNKILNSNEKLQTIIDDIYWLTKDHVQSSRYKANATAAGHYFHSRHVPHQQHWILSHRQSLQPISDLSLSFVSRSHTVGSMYKKGNTVGAVEAIPVSKRRVAWQSRRDFLSNLSDTSIGTYCGWNDGISYTVRKANVLVSLPPAMVRDVKYGYNFLATADMSENNSIVEESFVRSTCLGVLGAVIAADDRITRVGLSRTMKTQNNFARGITQSGTVGTEPFTIAGLNGSGVIVGVSDTGIDRYHCFFKDDVNGLIRDGSVDDPYFNLKYRKVIQYINFAESSGDYKSGHGTHVCGSIAGYATNGNSDTMMGMAPAAKIAFFDIGLPNSASLSVPYDFTTALFPQAFVAGARLHSNSWGGNYWYDSFCLETDEFLYDNPEMLVLFAGGNDGQRGVRSVLSPGLSKNVMAVAACDTTHTNGQDISNLAAFSSTGPAPDGRIKPDLAAPGNTITSANSNGEYGTASTCGTTPKAGTSMATPVMAGTASLVHQYFSDNNFWNKYCNVSYPFCKSTTKFEPSGALTKAVLIQSGVQMSLYNGIGALKKTLGKTPDTYQGFGRVNLKNVLPLKKASSAFALFIDERNMSSFNELVYQVVVTRTDVDLRVTLTWFDPPNPIFASKVLLHDLDLIVERGGTRFFGNAPRVNNGSPDASGGRDELNTVEQVIVSGTPLKLGTWNVRIQSKLLTEAELQSFAVVITVGGYVANAQESKPQPIAPATVQHCFSAGSNLVELHVSMFDFVGSNGWGTSDFFTLKNANTLAVTYTAYFTELQVYKQALTCQQTGTYEAKLNYHSSSEVGTQGSIPLCDVYLSPLHQSERFTLQTDDSIPAVSGVSQYRCQSSCYDNTHKILELLPYEESGEGWYGAYYSIQAETGISSFTSIASGTLEWDFYEYKSACLPIEEDSQVSQCFWLHLSVPTSTSYDSYPQLFILDSFYVDPITNDITAYECPYQLRKNESMARVCLDSVTKVWDVTHYAAPNYKSAPWYGFGQTVPATGVMSQAFNIHSLTKLGACRLALDPTTAPTSAPTMSPLCPTASPLTEYPTLLPTTLPTKIPTSAPTATKVLTAKPSQLPTRFPSAAPTLSPTAKPSVAPTLAPSSVATAIPTAVPTASPTASPTEYPTAYPSPTPTSVPTDVPSSSPTTVPSAEPTPSPSSMPTPIPTPRPTLSPTVFVNPYDHMDYSCLASCPNFPLDSSQYNHPRFEVNTSEACDFLIELLDTCSSVDIALGVCPIPACAMNCSIDVWCYFGAGATFNCPYWVPVTCDSETLDVKDKCIATMTSPASATGAPSSFSDSSSSKATSHSGIILGISFCFAFVFISLYLARQRIKNWLRPEHSQRNTFVKLSEVDSPIQFDSSEHAVQMPSLRGNSNYSSVPSSAFVISDDSSHSEGFDEEAANSADAISAQEIAVDGLSQQAV